ncbi:MAG: hypothetical protein EOO69_12980 [Moraxellaceae bacterium]|nr:MAG: hypothetical protein EOO69_12980 [Moraxellaceae bacterium]
MTHQTERILSKVSQITLMFWVIKIAATTLGETGGDLLSMSLGLGYLLSTAIFAGLFVVLLVLQISADRYHPYLYWATILASTTVGTTLADYVDRALGIGYAGGVCILVSLVVISLLVWKTVAGTISPHQIVSRQNELFYWLTITFSQTLGTALGDWIADSAGFGYTGGMLLFAGLLLLIIIAHFYSKISATLLFWLAFVLTRPLGAVVGDFLDKPIAAGGLDLSRLSASVVLLGFMVGCIYLYRNDGRVVSDAKDRLKKN